MSIENNIFNAIDIIVDRAIAKAGYDKTVTAFIVDCVNENLGKYKVRYQDSIYEATSDNTMTKYAKNTEIYLLIPEGDFSKRKKILGTVDALGADYINEVEKYEKYEDIGINVINTKEEIGLCSYDPDSELVLYQYGDNENNKLSVDNKSLKEYILQGSFLSIGAQFKTELDLPQRSYGNYGLIFNLLFNDEALKQPVIKQYVLDIDNMEGQPYNFPSFTSQQIAFEIANKDFIRIDSILAFAKDFRLKESNRPNDIFIQNLRLQVMVPLKTEESSSYYISLVTPQGTFFAETEDGSLEESASANDVLTLQAEVKNKGNIVKDVGGNKLVFYWFSENPSIDSKDPYFHIYGGQGWKCLNTFESTDKGVEWNSASNVLEIKKVDMLSKQMKYKCVCLYDDSILIKKEILIKNYDANYEIEIISSNGTEFNLDRGTTTLTCLVNKDKDDNHNYQYYWSKISSNEVYEKLTNDETTEALIKQANNLLNDINSKLATEKIYKEQYIKESNHSPSFEEFFDIFWEATGLLNPSSQTYEDVIELLHEYITMNLKNMIERNYIYNLSIKNIVNFVTYKCAVFKDDLFIGSASITLINSFNRDKINSLVLHNGNQVFKYDIKGVSPSSISKDNPTKPLALSFTIYDEKGVKVDDGVVEKNYSIKWKVPKNNTLLNMRETSDIEENGYLIYSDLYLPFEIVSLYNHNKNNNDIQLEITRDDLSLQASTNFSFLKEGSLDINGSEYFCRIVPNTTEVLKHYPMLTIFPDGAYRLNYNTSGTNSRHWFKVQFWKLDKMLWEDVARDEISWSILTNKYGRFSESSNIQVNDKTGEFSLSSEQNIVHPANIIKVTVQHEDIQYFATFPLVTNKQLNSQYKIALEKDSGFHEVVYTADGAKPQYNTSVPFKFHIQKQVDDLWVDISTSSSINYEFEIKGNMFQDYILSNQHVYLVNDKKQYLINDNGDYLVGKDIVTQSNVIWQNVYFLTEKVLTENEILPKNEKYFVVKDNYNGQCVNIGFQLSIKDRAGNLLTQLHVPIHFLLDKEGRAALGDWDGNSIQINGEEGGSVLTPQAGAGSVDKNTGTFTGVFVGSATDKNNKMRTGLLGYAKGQQSILLDAETGRAEFGTTSKIIIDPENDKAQIYSGSYIEKGTKLPDGTDSPGAGMLIDLSAPEIKFGTKSFMVDRDGKVTASDGTIAGWKISGEAFYIGPEDNPTFRISAVDYKGQIAGQYKENWRLNIGRNFGITSTGEMYSNNEVWVPGDDKPEEIQNSGTFSGYFNVVGANFGNNILFKDDSIHIAKTYDNHNVYTTLNSSSASDVAFATAAVVGSNTDAQAYNAPGENTPLRLFHNGLAEFKNIDIQGGTINLYKAELDEQNNIPLSKQGITVKVNNTTEYSFEDYINRNIVEKLSLFSQNGDNTPATHIYSTMPLYADDLFIKENGNPISITSKLTSLKTLNENLSSNIDNLESSNEELNGKIGELESLNEELSDKVGDFESSLESLSDELTGKIDAATTAMSTANQLQDDTITELQEKITTLEGIITTLQEKITILESLHGTQE